MHPLRKYANDTHIRDAIKKLFDGSKNKIVDLTTIKDTVNSSSITSIKRTLSGMIAEGEIKPIEPGIYLQIKNFK
jgi:hypothetical protein